MTTFVLRRLALAVLTLWVVSVIIFLATQVLPGDAARAVLGQSATPDRVAELQAQLHLDDSAVAQYWNWLSGILSGDPGQSLSNQRPVRDVIGDGIVNSLVLMLLAAAIAVPVAAVIGMVAAARRDTRSEQVISTSLLVIAALPEFVLAIGLTVLFSTLVFDFFPSISLLDPGQRPWDEPDLLVLPVTALVMAVVPYLVRIMRGSMVEALESDYVEMATLKGLRRSRVVTRHALPNAVAPSAQATALALAYLAGGVVVVEYVFAYPGIGQELVSAISARDIPVIQALTLLLAAFYIAVNLVADLITILVTPRLRVAHR